MQLFQITWDYWILKIGLFYRVKELFKLNQTRYEVSPVYLEEGKTKRNFGMACQEKS